MVSLTLSIPQNIRGEMEKFPEMNWSEVARAAIMQRLMMLKKFKEFTKDSKFTEQDALKFGAELNRSLSKRRLASYKK
jgi:hypothetical protein